MTTETSTALTTMNTSSAATTSPTVIGASTATGVSVKPIPYVAPRAQTWPRPEFADFVAAPDLNAAHIKELMQMHTFRRPGGSSTENKFCNIYLRGLPGAYRDPAGNYIVRVGKQDQHRVMWSSHTDTVHRTEGKQRLMYGEGYLSLHESEPKKECLGADCTVGVWIMRQMILRRIPGLYIFHAFEETGGHGSQYISKKTPDLVKDIDYAIAFDRRGISSVITHQVSRCASDAFGLALARALNAPGSNGKAGKFTLDTGGTFTDTANYTDLIPECTNLAVGYWGAHTSGECLDIGFADHLLNRVCALDVKALPVSRDPSKTEYEYSGYGGYYAGYAYGGGGNNRSRGNGRHRYVWDGGEWKNKQLASSSTDLLDDDALIDLVYLCKNYPGQVARFLHENGFKADDIEDFEVQRTIEEAGTSREEEDSQGSTDVLDLTQELKALEEGGRFSDDEDLSDVDGAEEDPETGLRRMMGR